MQIVWKRILVVLLVVTLLTGAAVGFSLAQPPRYEASIKLLIVEEPGANEFPTDVASLEELTQTMAEAVTTRPVAEAVIEELDLSISPDTLLANTSAQQISSTQIIEVGYTDTDPERARDVANAIGEAFPEEILQESFSANSITATTLEQATVPDEPASPDPVRNGVLAFMLALLLGSGLAILLENLDDSWRSPEELEAISGRPNLGVIPEFKVLEGKQAKDKVSEKEGEIDQDAPSSRESKVRGNTA